MGGEKINNCHNTDGNETDLDLDTVLVLINEAREGNQSAQSELTIHIESYLAVMADRKLDRSLRTDVGVSDIVQQSLVQMVQGIEKFRGESEREFYGWLNKIVESESAKARRHLRQQKRDVRRRRSLAGQDSQLGRPNEQADVSPTPGTQAVANERLRLFHLALQQLHKDYADVIRYRNLEQLSFKEVAARMDRSVNAVSNLWYRAILKFQQQLERFDESAE